MKKKQYKIYLITIKDKDLPNIKENKELLAIVYDYGICFHTKQLYQKIYNQPFWYIDVKEV